MSKDIPQWMRDINTMQSLDKLPKHDRAKSPFYQELQRVVVNSSLMNGRELIRKTVDLGSRLGRSFIKTYPDREGDVIQDKTRIPNEWIPGNWTDHEFISVPFSENPDVKQLWLDIRTHNDTRGEISENIYAQGSLREEQREFGGRGIDYTVIINSPDGRKSTSNVKIELRTPSSDIEIRYRCDANGDPLPKDHPTISLGCYQLEGGNWYEPDADTVTWVKDTLAQFGFLNK